MLSRLFGHDKEENVKCLTGDPKKAIVYLAVPAFFSLLILNLNSIIDGFWVAGLGKAELDATAFFTPIYGSIIAIGNGIGIGAAAVIARSVAKGDREHANTVGGQILLLTIIVSFVTGFIALYTCTDIFNMMGGGKILIQCEDYSYPVIYGTIFIVTNGVVAGMLRGEGDGRRSLVFLSSTVAFNIVLDPVFIYVFDWGLSGASTAMVVSSMLSLVLAYYWYYVKKDTFVRPSFVNIRRNLSIQKEILIISLPQTVELVCMAIFDIFTNVPVSTIGGEDAVAIYTIMWRIMSLLMIPAQAFASALIPVTSAAIAQRNTDKLREGIKYSLNFSIKLMIVAMFLLLIFADILVLAFSWSKDTSELNEPLAHAVRMCAFCVPFIPLTYIGSAVLQVTGNGFYAVGISLFRNLLHLGLFSLGAMIPALIAALTFWSQLDYFWIVFVFNMSSCSLLMYFVARWQYRKFNRTVMASNPETS